MDKYSWVTFISWNSQKFRDYSNNHIYYKLKGQFCLLQNRIHCNTLPKLCRELHKREMVKL